MGRYVSISVLCRSMEAKKIQEERIENRKKQAESKLAQMKHVEEKYEAHKKAIIEKAKCDIIKVSKQVFLGFQISARGHSSNFSLQKLQKIMKGISHLHNFVSF